jgi:ankyrin repeat protein
LPTGSEAYDYAYKDAMMRIEGQVEDQEELAKRVLSWITCTKRPLTTSELQHALAVDPGDSELGEDNIPQVEDVRSVCAGLVTVDEESYIIRLVHYTAQEYFERTQKEWFPNAEENITATCVTYLSFSTFETGFCVTNRKLKERLQLNPLYDYTARNWGYHARLASTDVEQSILDLLQSETKLSACSQVMMISGSLNDNSQQVPTQMTGVHLAAYFGLGNIMSALSKNRHDLDLKDTYGRTPLSWAAGNGHEAVVRQLLAKDGVDPNSEDKLGHQTPLWWAARNGHEAVVRQLLAKDGVDLDSGDKFGQTPLSWAAEKGHEVVVRQLLAKDGVDPDSKDSYGHTPLLRAARNGYEAVVRQLLAKDDVDPGSKDSYGRTPLWWAARNGHEAVVKLLRDLTV